MPAHHTSTTPPPSTSEPTAATGMKPPPPSFSAAEADAPPKKRKLEELGFHHSPYYKIRAAVANLRGRFLQVCRATDSQKEDAALEIQKELKFVMELSKKMRLDISAAAVEPVKPVDIPAVRAVHNKPAGEVPSGGKNQAPQIGERVQGSYVIGGSPMGWNFRMWPGGKAVYYGLTKAEWLARQAAE